MGVHDEHLRPSVRLGGKLQGFRELRVDLGTGDLGVIAQPAGADLPAALGAPAIVSEMSTPRYSGLISGGWILTGFWSVTSGSGSVKVMPGLISAVTAEEGEGVSCRRRAPRVPSGMAAAPASRAVSWKKSAAAGAAPCQTPATPAAEAAVSAVPMRIACSLAARRPEPPMRPMIRLGNLNARPSCPAADPGSTVWVYLYAAGHRDMPGDSPRRERASERGQGAGREIYR